MLGNVCLGGDPFIPKFLAWLMVFAGVIIFLVGVLLSFYSFILWSVLRVFDARGILMMIFGVIIFYVGYKNTGFILRKAGFYSTI